MEDVQESVTKTGQVGLSSAVNTHGNPSNKTYVSVLHVDIKALSSMKVKDVCGDHISAPVTPVSDSGLGQSDGGDGEFKSPQLESPGGKNNNSNIPVKTTHLDLDMQDKRVSPDFCPIKERRSLSNISSKKSKPHLATSQRRKEKETVIDSKQPLQWLDIHSDRKHKGTSKTVQPNDTKMTSRTSSNLSLQSKDDWLQVEKQLRKYEASGIDPHRALYAILSHVTPSSSRINTSRMDWQALAKSMGNESVPLGNDYFSIYSWSMRKKTVSNPLMDYIQQSSESVGDNAEKRETDTARGRPPKSRRNSGPAGVMYVQNARGFTKKIKSKTPGEKAIEEARVNNSKKSKMEAMQFEISVPKSKTSVSIPTLSKSSSVESLPYVDQNIRLPELPNNRVNNGKIYSGIYRLATPPTARLGVMKTASSVPSLHEEPNKLSFPLQVKNCGIPSSDVHLYTHAFKSYGSNSDLYRDKSYTLPMIYTNRTNTASSKDSLSETFHVHPLSREHKARQQRIILQTVYGRESTEPPRPPPVTPNVKNGRAVMSAGEIASLLHKHNRPYSKQNQREENSSSNGPQSNTSSFVQQLVVNSSPPVINDSESDEEFEDQSDEKSSIHSVSSIDCADAHQL